MTGQGADIAGTKDRRPRVSVVMAVKNGARHLREAIESIQAQTFADYEFLIVDDASDDETPDLLRHAAQGDDRIRILRNDRNIGPYPSANRAMAEARGEIIARLDADDRCAPDRLRRQVDFLDRHPDHLLVGSGYRSIDASGRARFLKPNPMDDFAVRWTACFRMPMVHPGFCFRARLPDGTPVRYREDAFVAQDYALAADLLAAGKAACIGDTLVDYRMHEVNISSTRKVEQNKAAVGVARRVLEATADAETAHGFAPFYNALYGVEGAAQNDLAAAAQAFRKLITKMPTAKQRSWLKRRSAGYLAEAFIKPSQRVWGMQEFLRAAPDFLLPFCFRLAEVKGVLKPDPTPGSE